MGSYSLSEYNHLLDQLRTYNNIPQDLILSLRHYLLLIYRTEQQNKFSEPMPWVGIYIALASLFCTLAMVADLLHGFRNRKLWFPCKYFTLNAASLSVIAVAIKLPMDLNNSMPGDMDLAAKLGSMAFMCTMMANLLPSLATMDNKELLTNIVALGVLVITFIGNVCIQLKTGLLSVYHQEDLLQTAAEDKDQSPDVYVIHRNGLTAAFYVGMLLLLLMIYACSSLAILKSKEMLESKYQTGHETILKDLQRGRLTVENLKQHVSNYWIMAGTSSPQFLTACSATSSASAVICILSPMFPILIMNLTNGSLRDYQSDYKWSMLVIFIIQFVGVVLGTIAPFFRCFASLSFKLSMKWIWNHIKVFEVENYWTQKLYDWKQSSIPFSITSRKSKIIIQNFRIIILSICIGFQKTVVVVCKIIAMIPVFFVIYVLYCVRCWNWIKAMFSGGAVEPVKEPEQLEIHKDLRQYVLNLHDDMELAERTLAGITKSVNLVFRKAEKKKPKNLMELLEKCSNFEGIGKYDNYHVPPLPAEACLHSWSLPLVTLTTIAVSLPNIQKNIVERLLSSVKEGLMYVMHVEESLNATDEYVISQRAAKMLWLEVEVYHKWLGNKLKKITPRENTAGQILQWFKDAAKNMSTEVKSTDIGNPNDNSIYRSICANSMYRISETILLSYHTSIDEVNQEELFVELSSMIADILAACLTNLPQVIAMKCHDSTIEKREATVDAAAKLFGETMHIINTLEDRELPCLSPDELPFIDKWCAYLKHPVP